MSGSAVASVCALIGEHARPSRRGDSLGPSPVRMCAGCVFEFAIVEARMNRHCAQRLAGEL